MTINRVLSLSKETTAEPVVVQQNDRQSRVIRLYVLENAGMPLPMEGIRARMLFRKNGATSPAYDAAIHADGWIQLTVPEAVTKNAGNGEMQLVLQKDESLLHSFTLPFVVKGSLSFVGETESPADDPMAVNWKNLPGKPTSFPPAGHTHTPAEAGALAAGGTAADAAKLGGKAPGYYHHPRNLLDNCDFSINQQGLSRYAGAARYTVDRWKTTNADTVVDVMENGIRLTNTVAGSGGYLQQTLENPAAYLGKTLTLAAMQLNGTLTVASATLPQTFPSAITQHATLSDNGVTVGAIQISQTSVWVRVWSNANEDTRSFRWVALYEGTYGAGDLPPFTAGKAAGELVECQRHYLPLSQYVRMPASRITASDIDFLVPLPVRMRVTPSLVGSFTVYKGSTAQTGFTFVVAGMGASALSVRATKANHGLTAADGLYLQSEDGVLSADL